MKEQTMTYKGQVFRTGDWVTCIIQGEPMERARIFVTNPNHGFICQNTFDGNISPDRLGFNYSWGFRLTEDSTKLDSIKNLRLANTDTPMSDISEYKVDLLVGKGFVSTNKPEKRR